MHRISHPLQNHKHREQGMDHPGVVAPLPEMTFASPPGKTNGQGNGSCSSETRNSQYLDYDSVGGGGLRKRSRTDYYNLNGCLECGCLECGRRMQVMEEVVGLLNQKLSALEQSSNGVLFSPMVMPPVVSQVVIPSTYTTPPATSVKVRLQTRLE